MRYSAPLLLLPVFFQGCLSLNVAEVSNGLTMSEATAVVSEIGSKGADYVKEINVSRRRFYQDQRFGSLGIRLNQTVRPLKDNETLSLKRSQLSSGGRITFIVNHFSRVPSTSVHGIGTRLEFYQTTKPSAQKLELWRSPNWYNANGTKLGPLEPFQPSVSIEDFTSNHRAKSKSSVINSLNWHAFADSSTKFESWAIRDHWMKLEKLDDLQLAVQKNGLIRFRSTDDADTTQIVIFSATVPEDIVEIRLETRGLSNESHFSRKCRIRIQP